MQLNVVTEKLDTLLSVVRASSRKEGKKADLVRDGYFDLSLTWMWCTHLAASAEPVDKLARTAAIRLTAKEALNELAPLVVAAAEYGDPLLSMWASSARQYLGTSPRIPKLRIAPGSPLRNLDGRPL